MNRITVEKLAWIVEGLRQGEERNVIAVPDDVAASARVALDRMLELRT
jgi:quinolinate synthase